MTKLIDLLRELANDPINPMPSNTFSALEELLRLRNENAALRQERELGMQEIARLSLSVQGFATERDEIMSMLEAAEASVIAARRERDKAREAIRRWHANTCVTPDHASCACVECVRLCESVRAEGGER